MGCAARFAGRIHHAGKQRRFAGAVADRVVVAGAGPDPRPHGFQLPGAAQGVGPHQHFGGIADDLQAPRIEAAERAIEPDRRLPPEQCVVAHRAGVGEKPGLEPVAYCQAATERFGTAKTKHASADIGATELQPAGAAGINVGTAAQRRRQLSIHFRLRLRSCGEREQHCGNTASHGIPR